MVKFFQMAAAGIFAAVAAASLIALAMSGPAQGADEPQNCHKVFCIVAFF